MHIVGQRAEHVFREIILCWNSKRLCWLGDDLLHLGLKLRLVGNHATVSVKLGRICLVLAHSEYSSRLRHRNNHGAVRHLIYIGVPLGLVTLVRQSISLRCDVHVLILLLLTLFNHQPIFGPVGEKVLGRLEHLHSLGDLSSMVVKSLLFGNAGSYTSMPCVE
jgi:hypothetical protein